MMRGEKAIFIGMPCGVFLFFFLLSNSLAFFILLHWQHRYGELICVLLPQLCSIHLVVIKLAFGRSALSLGHQTADITTTLNSSSSVGLIRPTLWAHRWMITARDRLSPSPPFPLLVRMNSFRWKRRISAHYLEPKGVWCVESAFDAWQVLSEEE